jgi:hypothetical protein
MNATTNENLSKQVDDVRWDVDAIVRGFQQPSNEFKPFTRWWWFGTASREEIRREMEGMALAGFGGLEIQTIYSALPGHPVEGYHDMVWLGDEWLDMVAWAVDVSIIVFRHGSLQDFYRHSPRDAGCSDTARARSRYRVWYARDVHQRGAVLRIQARP